MDLTILGLQARLTGLVVVTDHVPGGHAHEERSGHQPGAGDHVGEGRQGGDVGEHRQDGALGSVELRASRLGISSAPTGCCMKEFAAMMKYADKVEPSATAQIVARWTRSDILPQPKIHSPRNTDSRKKAARPSRARGAPNTSPTYRAYSDQFKPNWNSWTMPVAMPMPKFTISIEPKNLVIRVQASLRTGSLARWARVCMMATSRDRPMVSGTKMK